MEAPFSYDIQDAPPAEPPGVIERAVEKMATAFNVPMPKGRSWAGLEDFCRAFLAVCEKLEEAKAAKAPGTATAFGDEADVSLQNVADYGVPGTL